MDTHTHTHTHKYTPPQDDGLLKNRIPKFLQLDLDLILSLFEEIGLVVNSRKTKFMVVRGPRAPSAYSQDTYNDRYDKSEGEERIPMKEWRKLISECSVCKKKLTNGSMNRHMRSMHGVVPKSYSSCLPIIDTGDYRTSIVRNYVQFQDVKEL